MKINKLRLTAHAWKRLAQRGISLSDLSIVLKLGRKIHRAHADFYFLGQRNLPRGSENQLERLVGMTVVIEDNLIVTAYKNRRAIQKLKRKPKRFNGCMVMAAT
jgi:hypothetical protein